MRTFCLTCVLCLALLLTSTNTVAQTLSGGLVGGINASMFSDFPSPGPETQRRSTGLAAGVYLEFPLGRVVSLQAEVIYAQKGSRVEGPPAPGAASTVFLSERFDYVEVPILVRFGATGDRSGIYGVAGPAIARLVRARERFDVPGVPVLDQDIADGVNATDAGLVVGAGFSTGRLAIEGRLDVGLRNLIPPADRRTGDPAPANRSVGVVARLRL